MAAASKDSQPRATYYLFPSPSKQPDLAKVNFKVPPATTVNLDGTASRPPVQPAGKGRFKARVRRSGEKFLYYLGFKSSPIG